MEIKSRLINTNEMNSMPIDRLRKLAKDRGIDDWGMTRVELISAICYAEGYMVGKSEKAEKAYCSKAEPKREKVLLTDEDDDSVVMFHLTPDQKKLLEYLFNYDYIVDEVSYKTCDDIEEITI